MVCIQLICRLMDCTNFLFMKYLLSTLSVFLIAIGFSSFTFTKVNDTATIYLQAKVYLEGALIGSTQNSSSDGSPLMRDDLRNNPFTNQRVIPNLDIYQFPHATTDFLTIDVTNDFPHFGPGAYPEFQSVTNPNTVFSVEGDNAIVDWIFVELRDKSDYTNILATRSGLLQRDGDIVDVDGVSNLAFPDTPADTYFVTIRHRNHLAVMTKTAQYISEYPQLLDFTSPAFETFDTGTSINGFDFSGLAQKLIDLPTGDYMVMYGGDFDCNAKIIFTGKDSDVDIMQNELFTYNPSQNPNYSINFDQAIGYLQSDFDMNGKVKYSSPGDDYNYLYNQVVNFDQNYMGIENFGLMKQQLPE